MTVTTALPTSYKVELMTGTHNHTNSTGNTFKIALIKSSESGTYGAASTNYSNITGSADEASGTGYTAGGNTLTNETPTSSGTTAFTGFGASTSWSTATISSTGCMIYNSTNGNRAVYVGSFGGTVSSTAGTFTVNFPTTNSTTGLIRLA